MLGLLRVGDEEVIRLLLESGITVDALRESLEAALPAGSGERESRASDLPCTSRAKKVLALAQLESRRSGSPTPTGLHFLQAILREEENVAARVLYRLGLPGRARRAPLETLAEELYQAGFRWQP